MNPNRISQEDPRVTAYALGELEGAELAAVDAAVRADTALQTVVEEIRATAQTLATALESEPLHEAKTGELPAPREPYGKMVAFPYWSIAGLAAACFAVCFFVWRRDDNESQVAASKRVVQHQVKAAAPAGLADQASEANAPLAMVAEDATTDDRFFPTSEVTRSSFPLQVGAASFDDVKARLQRGERPRRNEVRVAELVNAFKYAWPEPRGGEPFAAVLEEAAAPWAPEHRLVRIGLKGREGAGELIAARARALVEFNPARVQAWRLIGFERNGGMVGVQSAPPPGDSIRAGFALTALYEVVPMERVEGRRPKAEGGGMLTMRLDYREPAGGAERRLEYALAESGASFAEASTDFRLAASVAAFGMVLQDSPLRGTATLVSVAQWAGAASAPRRESAAGGMMKAASADGRGNPGDQRAEFLNLVRQAQGVLR